MCSSVYRNQTPQKKRLSLTEREHGIAGNPGDLWEGGGMGEGLRGRKEALIHTMCCSLGV